MTAKQILQDFLPPIVVRSATRLRSITGRQHIETCSAGGQDQPDSDDHNHPERLVVLPFLSGAVLEIGCGHRKTLDSAIAVDLTPGGEAGVWGNVAGMISAADAAADGSCLPFKSQSFDTLVARHNLEHYVDIIGVLREWHRVLRKGGQLVVVVPDEQRFPGRTLDLDPTHYHAFTETSLWKLVEVTSFSPVESKPVIHGWSFMLRADRT